MGPQGERAMDGKARAGQSANVTVNWQLADPFVLKSRKPGYARAMENKKPHAGMGPAADGSNADMEPTSRAVIKTEAHCIQHQKPSELLPQYPRSAPRKRSFRPSSSRFMGVH
ncbi:hypothetical protein E4U54_000121 [Claviceps lovelessii]|nr:hypothetical protein E4U54_000121 [Claviceps lovelessii]